MPSKPVKIKGKTFKSQKEFKIYVKQIIYDEIGICNDIKNTYPDLYNILINILERHPEFESKTQNMCNLKIHKTKKLNQHKEVFIRIY